MANLSGKDPAYPRPQVFGNGVLSDHGATGMSKIEVMALAILQGIVASKSNTEDASAEDMDIKSRRKMVKASVIIAQELLDALSAD